MKKNPTHIDKECPTCQNIFKCNFYKRKTQRFCSKTCAQHHPDTLIKMSVSQKKKHDEKYGGKHPMQTEKTMENFKSAMLKKHKVDHPAKMANHLKKVKQTLLDRYGDENYSNREKRKNTCLERYGVENYVYTDEYTKKTIKTNIKKYGSDYHSRSKRFKLICNKNMFEKFIKHDRFEHFTPLFSLDDYNGLCGIFKKRYKFKCNRCSRVGDFLLNNGKIPHCINCDKENMSYLQKEITDYIRSIIGDEKTVVIDDRMILYPKEVDIYVPSLKLAIECNGLYWHSECIGGKNKVYHLNKPKQCMSKEVNLIQIWESEWKQKEYY